MTVLFADVVRSMDIAAAVDAERLREVMTELVERSAAAVQRYGGTVEYNGDGVMALFGAPLALEDHAFRGCLAALAIQEEAHRLAADVHRRDGVALRVRVGLNSGRVIAGELGSGSLGYAATGAPVGFAQRMESVAPPGGVMLSESTARLVEEFVTLADPQLIHIKGASEPVPARLLLAIRPRDGLVRRTEAGLVGRRRELATLDAVVERAASGRGGVVTVVGPPGIGKSRVAREAARLAAARGVDVFWVFCESHLHDVPFHVVAALLRAAIGVSELDGEAARIRVRAITADADPQDLLLLDDLLGVADPGVALPRVDRDARRRRLTSLLNAVSIARTAPALFVVEDVHWIDTVSESLLVDLLSVIRQTRSAVLITARPEYGGALARLRDAEFLSLAPLHDSDITALLGELMGDIPSINDLATTITERAAGNPFFAAEMVREMAQRGVLAGSRGSYSCRANVADVTVPATVQAAIEARIDRLSAPAKQTLNAASVIGTRFGSDLLAALDVDAVLEELTEADLIDQVRSSPRSEYAFHHPLIRSVAYESQLRTDRCRWHRRLADAIQERAPELVEESAALIAAHLEAAGDLPAAYGWHMRSAAWSTNRDLVAARLSWERARQIADALPDDVSDQVSMQIAPRTMLCATDWQARDAQDSQGRFAELKDLCAATGDKVSLAIGMTGPATELCYAGRAQEAARMSSQQVALLESIDDPTPIMGLVAITFVNWLGVGQFGEILRWSQTVIDLADGDPTKGAAFGVGSPLAIASAWRGTARWWLGRSGWTEDLHDAVSLARRSNPETLSGAVAWTYGFAVQYGVLQADDSALRAGEDAMRAAHTASSDRALGLATYTLAVGLLSREEAADRDRGLGLMTQARDIWLRKHALFLIPVTDVWAARESVRRGDGDTAIPKMRQAVEELRRAGHLFYGVWGTGVLVETLLGRGSENDVAEAQAAVDRMTTQWVDDGSAIRAITLLRLRALLARARGDGMLYSECVIGYRSMANSLGFEGHIAWAEAMVDSRV